MSTKVASANDLAAQNEELWRVVEKQRITIQNLHRSLAKMTEERDSLLERQQNAGLAPMVPPSSQESRSRTEHVDNFPLPARTPPPIPQAETPETPTALSPGPVPPPRSPYRQNSAKEAATLGSYHAIAHDNHNSDASDMGTKVAARPIPPSSRHEQNAWPEPDRTFDNYSSSVNTVNSFSAAESLIEKDAQVFAKYHGAVQRKEGSSTTSHSTPVIDPYYSTAKARSANPVEDQRKPSDSSSKSHHARPNMYETGYGNSAVNTDDVRRPPRYPEEATTPTAGRREDRREEQYATPMSTTTKTYVNNPMAGITVQVVGSTIVTNEKGKEAVSFTIAVRRGPDALDPSAPLEELWRVQKLYADFVALDSQLRSQGPQVERRIGRLPDKSYFATHSPNKADQGKVAIENYLQLVLSITLVDVNDLCEFLSSNVLSQTNEPNKPVRHKQGYLTKRGKNFGGWKSRYFVLDESVLNYFDGEDGPFLGVIKLTGAQIGAQIAQPSENGRDAPPFKHAFMILEPKKSAPGGVHRHILCAGSDAERDEWVEAIKQYIDPNAAPIKQDKRSHKKADKSKLYSRSKSRHRSSIDQPYTATHDSSHGYSKRNSIGHIPHDGASDHSSSTDSNNRAGEPDDDLDHLDPRRAKQKNRRTFWGKKMFASSGNDGSQASSYGRDNNTRGANQVFGVPLEEAVRVSRVSDKYELPAIVYRCIEFLESRNAVQEEGLYRLSGSAVKIKELKARFNEEGDVDLLGPGETHDVHAVAGLLKMWLRELPGNALTNELFKDFLHVVDLPDRHERVRELGRLVSLLPLANYTLLRILSAHLIRVVQNAALNKMTMRNVGIVFSATLGIPAGIFSLLLTEFDYVFWTHLEKNGNDEMRQPANISPLANQTQPSAPQAPAIPRPQPPVPNRFYEDKGRSNRNSVSYMDGAPKSIVGLEQLHHGTIAIVDEEYDDGDDFGISVDEDNSLSSEEEFYPTSESSQAPSSSYEYHTVRYHS